METQSQPPMRRRSSSERSDSDKSREDREREQLILNSNRTHALLSQLQYSSSSSLDSPSLSSDENYTDNNDRTPYRKQKHQRRRTPHSSRSKTRPNSTRKGFGDRFGSFDRAAEITDGGAGSNGESLDASSADDRSTRRRRRAAGAHDRRSHEGSRGNTPPRSPVEIRHLVRRFRDTLPNSPQVLGTASIRLGSTPPRQPFSDSEIVITKRRLPSGGPGHLSKAETVTEVVRRTVRGARTLNDYNMNDEEVQLLENPDASPKATQHMDYTEHYENAHDLSPSNYETPQVTEEGSPLNDDMDHSAHTHHGRNEVETERPSKRRPKVPVHEQRFKTKKANAEDAGNSARETKKKWVGRGPKAASGSQPLGKRVRVRDYVIPYDADASQAPITKSPGRPEQAGSYPLPYDLFTEEEYEVEENSDFLDRFPDMRVAAYCIADDLDIRSLSKWIRSRQKEPQVSTNEGIILHEWQLHLHLGALHAEWNPITISGDVDAEVDVNDLLVHKDVFLFTWGCLVFWGTTPEEENAFIDVAKQFSETFLKRLETDDMQFRYGLKSTLVHDVITLITIDAREKLSISFAMAQSVKLDFFESRVEDVIEEYRHIPANMRKFLDTLSHVDLSKMIGKIYLERTDVNLNSDILDEPEFFWESDEWLPLYKKIMAYLEVESRVALLNAKLQILRELLVLLNNQLQRKHGLKLEWIIIWLIVANVTVLVLWHIVIKDMLGLFHHCIPYDPSSDLLDRSRLTNRPWSLSFFFKQGM